MSRYQSEAPEGQPSHTPAIRIRGVEPGSSQHNAIVDAHSGALKQFIGRHQQQVKLSGQRVYKASKHVPGARLTYHNNEGQETITMVVDVVPEGEEESVPRETPWEFAMVDFALPDVTKGSVFFAAFLAKPMTTQQKAMTDDTLMPVQGISAYDWDNAEKPIVEWADWNALDAQLISDSNGATDITRSLRVDLRPFPNQVVEVDIYGFNGSITEEGGPQVDDDGHVGILSSVDRWGSLTQDYRSFNASAWDPSSLAAAPEKLFLDTRFNTPEHYANLIKTFPELDGVPHEYLGSGDGDPSIGNQFKSDSAFSPCGWINDDLTTTWGDSLFDRPSSVSPNNDPNPWLWRTFRGTNDLTTLTVTVEWAPGQTKTKTVDAGWIGYEKLTGGGYVNTLSDTVETTTTAGSFSGATNYYRIQYYVPTWIRPKSRTLTVRAVCAKNGNPWQAFSHQNAASGAGNGTFKWEVPATFPVRPKMKDVGTGVLPYGDGGVGDDWEKPARHFGALKVGTLKIDTRSGGVKFVAA